MPRLTRRPDGKLLCRGGKIRPCDCEPGGGCCPTPYAPITTGDCGNRWRIHVTRYGIDNTTTSSTGPFGEGPIVATFQGGIDPFDGSLAGPQACQSCAAISGLRTTASFQDCSGPPITLTDQQIFVPGFAFSARCFGHTAGLERTTAPPPTGLFGLDLALTNGALGRWIAFGATAECYPLGALVIPEVARELDSGLYPNYLDSGWNLTVSHSWAIDESGYGYWQFRVQGTNVSTLTTETIDESVSVDFQIETIEPCTTPTPLPIQPCADMRYWVRATPCPGSPFSTPVYALVSPLDPCGVLPVPGTSPRVCVQVDPSSQQFPACPPGAICITDPIDPDIRDCCQCVEGCESITLVRGELGQCITDVFDGDTQRCCCHDDMHIRLLSARGQHITPSFTEEYVLTAPAVGTFGTGIAYTMQFRVNGEPSGAPEFNIRPGCGWLPSVNAPMNAPWDISGMHVEAQAGWRYDCRQAGLPPGGTLVAFRATRSCHEYIYHAEWTYQTGILERFIHDFVLQILPGDNSVCGGGCGPTILPGKAIPKITTSSGCVGCKKGEGL